MENGKFSYEKEKEENNNKIIRTPSPNINQKYNKLGGLDTEFINLEQKRCEEIFDIFNNIRSNPQNYLTEAKKYNADKEISSAIDKKENIKNLIKNPFFDLFFDKCVKASPKSDKEIIKNIEKENLFKDYEKKLYIIEGNKEKMDECVWNLIKNCANDNEDILTKDIDHLVISTMTLEDGNKFLCYFLFLSKTKENSNIDNI